MAVLGVDLGGTNVRVGLIDGDKLVKTEACQISPEKNYHDVLNNICETIDCFKNAQVEGIGIGVPSIVDVEKGIVYNVQNIPSWQEVPLKDLLEKRYRVPVYVNNDANCFAVGEKYFGRGKKYQNIVGLIMGTGLGAGIIVNDRLYSGTNCAAGEFGNISFKEKNFEYYCCGQFFSAEQKSSGEELSERARKNDSKALKIFAEFGSNVGEAIKLVMYCFDPEIIILGGSVSKSYGFFKDSMWQTLRDFAYPKMVEKIRIELSDVSNIAILGAAALYYDSRKTV